MWGTYTTACQLVPNAPSGSNFLVTTKQVSTTANNVTTSNGTNDKPPKKLDQTT